LLSGLEKNAKEFDNLKLFELEKVFHFVPATLEEHKA
jgi:hypothetical protein